MHPIVLGMAGGLVAITFVRVCMIRVKQIRRHNNSLSYTNMHLKKDPSEPDVPTFDTWSKQAEAVGVIASVSEEKRPACVRFDIDVSGQPLVIRTNMFPPGALAKGEVGPVACDRVLVQLQRTVILSEARWVPKTMKVLPKEGSST